MTEAEQLKLFGFDDPAILRDWKDGRLQTIDQPVLQRISCVFGVFRAINTILQEPARADAWLRKPNNAPMFGGASALDRMTSGGIGDLLAVRRYLEAQCS